jgi:hypothetical protein
MTQDTTEVLIYANHSKGHFNIKTDLTIKNVKIYDTLGLLVHNENYNTKEKKINISNLTRGGYIVTSETKENVEISNVLIIN